MRFVGLVGLLVFLASYVEASPCSVSFESRGHERRWSIRSDDPRLATVETFAFPGDSARQQTSRIKLQPNLFKIKATESSMSGSTFYLDPIDSSVLSLEFNTGGVRPLGPYDLKACYKRCAKGPADGGVCRSVCDQTEKRWSDYQRAYFEADLAGRNEGTSFTSVAVILKTCLEP